MLESCVKVILSTAVLIVIFGLTSATDPAVITVCQSGCGYGSIQSAVDAAQPGDTIEVQSGTYYESINVSKGLSIQGVDSGTGRPVIDAGGKGSVVTFSADGITLDGFIIKGSDKESPGILMASNGNALRNNDISNQGRDGIYLERFGNNEITGNTLAYNGRNGIFMKDANNNILEDNVASFNSRDGFYLESSSSNVIEYNVASKNKNGVSLDRSSNNFLHENELKSNAEDGISLSYSNANTLSCNNVSYDYNGIYLVYSIENLVDGNVARKNYQDGIRLVSSAGNVLYENELVDNQVHDSYDDGETNQWDDGGVGNLYGVFSKNCTDDDGDGYCDQRYSVPGGLAVDRYPLAFSLETPDKYLFLELWTRENGTLLSGVPYKIMIDFPTYRLEDDRLISLRPVDLPSSTIAILGSGHRLGGDLGGGASSGLEAVTNLPHKAGNLTVLTVEGDEATVQYDGEKTTLAPGDSWVDQKTETRTVGEATLEVTKTVTITNQGMVALVEGN